MSCKKCGCKDGVKNGLVRGKQRYKCAHCGYNYTSGDARTKGKLPPQAKAYILRLERLLKVRVKYVSIGTKRDEIIVR